MIKFVSIFLVAFISSYFLKMKKGLFQNWRNKIKNIKRTLFEDALKQLYNQTYKGKDCTLETLAQSLNLPIEKTQKLVDQLVSSGMVICKNDRLELTDAGEKYALRVIRIHRLWERYLADETGIDAIEWHKQAEFMEHKFNDTEIEALAASLGHPSYDPHGDPIPTVDGELPPQQGVPMNHLKENEVGLIVHIEDEPPEIYKQLIAQNLHPKMQIKIIKKTPDRLYFLANGKEQILSTAYAKNITTIPLKNALKSKTAYQTLASLQIGEKGKVIGISKACRRQQRHRLMDLGVVPGTIITAEMESPGGDPVAYKIRGATIALRKEHARMIYIQPVKEVK